MNKRLGKSLDKSLDSILDEIEDIQAGGKGNCTDHELKLAEISLGKFVVSNTGHTDSVRTGQGKNY